MILAIKACQTTCWGSLGVYDGWVMLYEVLYCFFLVNVAFLPGNCPPEMSHTLPEDPHELAKWLKREKNLNVDICKVLRGKRFISDDAFERGILFANACTQNY